MNKEMPASSGGFITLCASLLLALPIAYVASSGPVLAAASKKQMTVVNGVPFHTYSPVFPSQRPWAAEFYSPLFRAAATLRLEPKLDAYLGWSGATVAPACGYQVMILPPRPAATASKR